MVCRRQNGSQLRLLEQGAAGAAGAAGAGSERWVEAKISLTFGNISHRFDEAEGQMRRYRQRE